MTSSVSSSRVSITSSSSSSISDVVDTSISETEDSSHQSPRVNSKKSDGKKISEIKNDWSASVHKMESHLAELGQLLTDMKVLLDELKSLLGDKPSTNLDDLIKSFAVAIKDTNNLKEQLVKVNNTIKDLSIPGAKNNEEAMKKLLKIKAKMAQMIALSINNTAPKIPNPDDSSSTEDQADSSAEEGLDSENISSSNGDDSSSLDESEISSKNSKSKKAKSSETDGSEGEKNISFGNGDDSSTLDESEFFSENGGSKGSNSSAEEDQSSSSGSSIRVGTSSTSSTSSASAGMPTTGATEIKKNISDLKNKFQKNIILIQEINNLKKSFENFSGISRDLLGIFSEINNKNFDEFDQDLSRIILGMHLTDGKFNDINDKNLIFELLPKFQAEIENINKLLNSELAKNRAIL